MGEVFLRFSRPIFAEDESAFGFEWRKAAAMAPGPSGGRRGADGLSLLSPPEKTAVPWRFSFGEILIR